jgi:hypothetical protein
MSLTDRRLLVAALGVLVVALPYVAHASAEWMLGYGCGYVLGAWVLWAVQRAAKA